MRKFNMTVDTSSGFVTIECEAKNQKAAWEYFKKYCRSQRFRDKFGNLWDMKKNTLKEITT